MGIFKDHKLILGIDVLALAISDPFIILHQKLVEIKSFSYLSAKMLPRTHSFSTMLRILKCTKNHKIICKVAIVILSHIRQPY